MKIISRIIKTFFALVILGSILVYAFLYLLLLRETESLRAVINQARGLAFDIPHRRDCLEIESPTDGYQIEAYQVRFTSGSDYVIEVVCAQNDRQLILVSSHRLAFGVSKLPGYSGMYLPIKEDPDAPPITSSLVLGLYGLHRAITYQDQSLASFATDQITKPDPGSSYAPNTCQGWGYICCDSATQVGEGTHQRTGVTDCSADCFEACNSRPVILFFHTDPRLSADTRQVSIQNNQLLLFSYSVQDPEGEPTTVTIDFGDGESTSTTNVTDSVSHTYTCQQSRCSYTVTLTVTDQSGLSQAASRLSQITVGQTSL